MADGVRGNIAGNTKGVTFCYESQITVGIKSMDSPFNQYAFVVQHKY